MTRRNRLALGIMLCAVLAEVGINGCAGSEQLTPDQGVQLSVLGVQTACTRCYPGACVDPSVLAVCAAWSKPATIGAAGNGGMSGVGSGGR
jgi:hypothetical protein